MARTSIYDALSSINRGFEQIVEELERLRRLHLFRGKPGIQSCRLAVEETRAWAAFEILEVLHEREQREWARFGRLRSRAEQRLEDSGDARLAAERETRKRSQRPARRKRTAPRPERP